MIMRELRDMEGFRISGTVINNRRHADDTVILTESEELQRLINVVVAKSEQKGLHRISAKLLFVFRDLRKEWGDSNSTTGGWSRWNILMCFIRIIYHSEHYGLIFGH